MLEKTFSQQRYVLESLTQWRCFDFNGADAEVKILTKRSVSNHLRRVAICRRDETKIDVYFRFIAEPAQFSLLEHAQQLGLKVDGHLRDLVEEQGATGRRFDQTAFVTIRSSERAPLIAEQF